MSKTRAVHTVESLKARTIVQGDCWLWQGYSANNTPQVGAYPDGKKTMVSVRKLMRELLSGQPQPAGHYGQTCGNPLCVNPSHTLWRGEKSHMRHMAKKRKVTAVTAMKLREYRIKSGMAKIDEAQAEEIRMSNESGPVLAERFGVSKSWINKIKRGRAWRVLSSAWEGLIR